MNPRTIRWAMAAAAVLMLPARALDVDADGLDDVWQQLYHAEALTAGADADGDIGPIEALSEQQKADLVAYLRRL